MTNLENSNSETSQQNESILQYVRMIATYRKMILFITIIGFLVSIVICLLLPNIYSTKALILPPQQDQNLMGAMLAQMGGMASVASDILGGGGNQADMYVGILKTDAIKDAIIDRFELLKVYNKKDRISTYGEVDKWVTITSGKKDGIISINVEDKDPKRAAEIANNYVSELQKLMIQMNSTGAGENKKYLAERLGKAKSDLSRAEDAIKRFQSYNKAVDIPEQARGTIKGIADLSGQLAVQEVQLETLRRQFTDSSQEVKSIKRTIEGIKAQIAKYEGKSDNGAIPTVGSIPDLGQQYLRLMRDFKIQETLVELLTKQYEMSSLTESKNTYNIQIIQKARVPDRKSKPKRAIIVIASTLASFMLSVMAAFVFCSYKNLPEDQKALLIELKQSIFSWKRS